MIQDVPGWRENRERMEKEYIAPRAVDAEWADAIIIGTNGAPPELKDYLGSLDALRSEGKLGSKAGTAFIVVPSGSQPDAMENARLQGRQVTEAARAMKRSDPLS